MKRREMTQLGGKEKAELRKILAELRGKLVKLKMERTTEKVKNVRAAAGTRDEIAQVMTILRQKEEEEKT